MTIEVFAGFDTVLCENFTFDLSGLNASISGDVSDGVWFTTGDGQFLPGNLNNVVFSVGTHYIPGPEDLANGSFELILVSDDPDGIGPLPEQSDVVQITFQQNPPLVCVADVALSINEDCSQEANIYMFIQNPVPPFSYYQISLFDEQGQQIPDNIIDHEHIGQYIDYEITYLCNSNICSGEIFIEDKIPPTLNCSDLTIDCNTSYEVADLGFPVPPDATIQSNGDGTYAVEGLDACGIATLSYIDEVFSLNCQDAFYSKIYRSWTAIDPSGNSLSCLQKIFLERVEFNELDKPQNYDDLVLPALHCDGNWETLPDGHPSPETTGYPELGHCYYFEYSYSDIEFPLCGDGYKILREWLIVDWCEAESYEFGQIIKVVDVKPPVFECPEDQTIGTNPYECVSDAYILPLPGMISDCSNWTIEATIQDISNGQDYPVLEQNNEFQIDNLPIGTYEIAYIITDDCANADTCFFYLTVIDDDPPFAICDHHTTISLGSNGLAQLYAMSIDDGSLDNCGIVEYEVAKMTDVCAANTSFGPYVEFCCDEAGETIMVQFRVTDANGHTNMCMVEVAVAEKLPPEIHCPSDLTVNCDFDYTIDDLSIFGTVHTSMNDIEDIIINDLYNGGVAGQDGYISDNCGATVSDTAYVDLECNQGTIIRKFIVEDLFGQKDSCEQTILFINLNPFNEQNIDWPDNLTFEACNNANYPPDSTGIPLYSNENCSSVASSYLDEEFEFVIDACKKIIRHWTVIDWCQYNSETGDGLWTHDQIIKIQNTEGPVFDMCQDTTICSYGDNCIDLITLVQSAIDDCTAANELNWSWQLDLDNDGIYDIEGGENETEVQLETGQYQIKWTVEDGCGNLSECEYQLEVKDCKEPTPYCVTFLTTVLMEESNEITIWASDFNYGSFDNCTADEDLVYSFSSDTLDGYRTYTCEDIYNGIAHSFPLEIWVTDEAGNQDFCEIVITIQDNSDVCEDHHGGGIVGGQVATPSGTLVDQVEMTLSSDLENYSLISTTNQTGMFSIDSIPLYLNYELDAQKNTEANEGVSTLDMLQIQRHILGLETFTSPYQLIAADINNSNKVSAIDLVQLRKVILGIDSQFPENDSWRFVPSDYVFEDVENPWFFDESIVFEPLEENHLNSDFVGIKIGDVNQSFSLTTENLSSNRSQPLALVIEIIEFEDRYKVHIDLETDHEINGIQFCLSFLEAADLLNVQSSNDKIRSDHFAWESFNEAVFAFSWSDVNSFKNTEKLVSLEFDKTVDIKRFSEAIFLDTYLNPEVYSGQAIHSLVLNIETDVEENMDVAGVNNYPNPFSTYSFISFETQKDQYIQFRIIDVQGREVFSEENYYRAGQHKIKITANQLAGEGIYFYQLRMNEKTISRSLVFTP